MLIVELVWVEEGSPGVRIHRLHVGYSLAFLNYVRPQRPFPFLVGLKVLDRHQPRPIQVLEIHEELFLINSD